MALLLTGNHRRLATKTTITPIAITNSGTALTAMATAETVTSKIRPARRADQTASGRASITDRRSALRPRIAVRENRCASSGPIGFRDTTEMPKSPRSIPSAHLR